ncbi:MAG: hypothetical protein R3E52_07530 [Burkholderiaceae bacterium]
MERERLAQRMQGVGRPVADDLGHAQQLPRLRMTGLRLNDLLTQWLRQCGLTGVEQLDCAGEPIGRADARPWRGCVMRQFF